MNWHRMFTVVRTDLKQLVQAKDYWMPMVALGALFFLVLPAILLLTIESLGSSGAVQQISQTLKVLPAEAQAQIRGDTPTAKTSYALAVYLFAPIAIVVPLTISTAVAAAAIVGERERGTGEFLAHSPATTREIYLGKLIASFIPGYATTLGGFAVYSVVVNVIAGPSIGGIFFPTPQWWGMVLWVVPPFLAITLSVVLRLSARVKSTAAAQQAAGLVSLPLIGLAYGQSTGSLFGAGSSPLIVGTIAWLVALISLIRGMRSVTRSRLLGVANGV
jgi:ABC-type Na+ efflux pump permease subunit